MKAKMMRNVELVSLAIDEAGFASLRIRDRDTGDVYTVPGGYVPLVEGGLPTADVRFESYRDGEAWRFSATHVPTGVRVGAYESRERALQMLCEAVTDRVNG